MPAFGMIPFKVSLHQDLTIQAMVCVCMVSEKEEVATIHELLELHNAKHNRQDASHNNIKVFSGPLCTRTWVD